MRKAKVLPLGTINGFSLCRARVGRKHFTFNGTVVGLVQAASAAKVEVDQHFYANFGFVDRKYILTTAPHETRTNGVWTLPC